MFERNSGRMRILALLALAPLLCSCPRFPLRQPSPLPPPDVTGRLAALRPPGEALDFEIELLRQESGVAIHRFQFRSRSGSEKPVVGEYYQVEAATARQPAPLLQIAPILGGALNDYLVSRIFAGWAAEAGISSFFLHQDGIILGAEVSARRMQEMLIQTTHENVQALRVLSARPEVDSASLACFGISLGAIKNVLLLAAEPDLAGGVFCLAGGELPRIFELSREGMVEDYLARRREHADLTREEVIERLEHEISLDPIDVAPLVGAERALLYLGTLDDKVHYLSGLALHRALGRPELRILPLGHYTGIVAVPWVARESFAWLHERFEREKKREGELP